MEVAADLPVIDLEMHLRPWAHVYGALVLYLLGMRRVQTAARSLKVALLVTEHRCIASNPLPHSLLYAMLCLYI